MVYQQLQTMASQQQEVLFPLVAAEITRHQCTGGTQQPTEQAQAPAPEDMRAGLDQDQRPDLALPLTQAIVVAFPVDLAALIPDANTINFCIICILIYN